MSLRPAVVDFHDADARSVAYSREQGGVLPGPEVDRYAGLLWICWGKAGVGQFLFVSSVAVYHEILPDRKLDENHPTWPSSLYGAYKAAVEPHLKAYHVTYGMNTSSWRPAAISSGSA